MVLFNGDLQKEGASLHLTTKNTSFLRMSKVLQLMGIKNHLFFLALYDKSLEHVDPYNEKDPVIIGKIAIECHKNPWYFFREVCRVPVQGSTEGAPFELNRALLAMIWLFLNDIDTFTTIPRQCGKTTTAFALIIYMYVIRASNILIGTFYKDTELRTQDIKKFKLLRDLLPEYFIYKDPKHDRDNEERLVYASQSNELFTAVAQPDEISADKRGRGPTFSFSMWDEMAYYKNNDITYSTASFAINKGKEQALLQGLHCASMITTTAGKLQVKSAQFANSLRLGSLRFTDKYYDFSGVEELKEIVHVNSTQDMVYIEYSYLQLGKDDEWLAKQSKGKKPDVIKTELLNQWIDTTDDPILSQMERDALQKGRQEPSFITTIQSVLIKWYIPKSIAESSDFCNQSLILGNDTSSNTGHDYTTGCMIDPMSLETIATFKCNSVNLIYVVVAIFKLMMKYPKLTLIPERNYNSGLLDLLISKLQESGQNPFTRIYNQVVQDYDTFKDKIDIHAVNPTHGSVRKYFGFITTASKKSRPFLYQHVMHQVLQYGERVHDESLINEYLGLTLRNNRIDHSVGGNDDLAIAHLIACYLVLHGKYVRFYGLDPNKLLSVDADGTTMSNIEKAKISNLRKRMQNLQLKIQSCKSTAKKHQYQSILRDLQHKCPKVVTLEENTTITKFLEQPGIPTVAPIKKNVSNRIWF